MTAPTTTAAAAQYLDGVRVALADLPDEEREDLLEDLRGHLDEVLAEDPAADLSARLGTAASYAEELRQSAGLPPKAPGGSAPSVAERLGMLGSAVRDVLRGVPGGAAVLGFLPQLRPAWWVLRVWGVVALLDVFAHKGRAYRWGTDVIPTVHGSGFFGLLLLAGLITLSVRLGMARSTGWQRRLLIVANAALIVATPAYFARMNDGADYVENVTSTPCCGQLYGEDGRTISNIYAYDENGKLIPRVQLFDQDGNPINLTGNVDDGSPLHNVFPQKVPAFTVTDEYGNQLQPSEPYLPAPTVVAPRLAPTAAPLATRAPTSHSSGKPTSTPSP